MGRIDNRSEPLVRFFLAPLCLLLTATFVSTAPAYAGSGAHVSGDLKSSSGGTGLGKNAGNGGTGVPTTANAPQSTLQSTFKPVHVTAPPPAGVRPHTDLAAAEKRTMLSSRGIIKRSSLYNKIATHHGDPRLMRPVMNKIAYPDGGGSSFKALQGFTAAESKGNIYPTHGGTSGRHLEAGSLTSSAHTAMADGEGETDERPGASGWLTRWLLNILAVAGSAGLALLLWQQAPKGARMTLPATTTA